jgi:hypothetical protein
LTKRWRTTASNCQGAPALRLGRPRWQSPRCRNDVRYVSSQHDHTEW